MRIQLPAIEPDTKVVCEMWKSATELTQFFCLGKESSFSLKKCYANMEQVSKGPETNQFENC